MATASARTTWGQAARNASSRVARLGATSRPASARDREAAVGSSSSGECTLRISTRWAARDRRPACAPTASSHSHGVEAGDHLAAVGQRGVAPHGVRAVLAGLHGAAVLAVLQRVAADHLAAELLDGRGEPPWAAMSSSSEGRRRGRPAPRAGTRRSPSRARGSGTPRCRSSLHSSVGIWTCL